MDALERVLVGLTHVDEQYLAADERVADCGRGGLGDDGHDSFLGTLRGESVFRLAEDVYGDAQVTDAVGLGGRQAAGTDVHLH